jgi:hypothetical protein
MLPHHPLRKKRVSQEIPENHGTSAQSLDVWGQFLTHDNWTEMQAFRA